MDLFFQNQKSSKRHVFVRAIVVLVWAACVGIILWGGWKNRDLLIPYLVNAEYSRLTGVFITYLGSLIMALVGWSSIMYLFDKTINWWKNTQIYCLTLAARRLPGTFWYVGGRLVMYQQLGVSKIVTTVTSSIELITSVVSGGFLGLALLLVSGIRMPVPIVVGIAIGSIIGILFLHPSALKAILNRNGKELLHTISLWNVCTWLLAYTIMWALSGAMVCQLVLAFQPIGARAILLTIGAWALSGTIGVLTFFLPSSFGATEVTLTVLLSQILPLPLAGTVAILTRLITIIFEVILSAAFFPLSRSFSSQVPDASDKGKKNVKGG
jgi:hypothetical protein